MIIIRVPDTFSEMYPKISCSTTVLEALEVCAHKHVVAIKSVTTSASVTSEHLTDSGQIRPKDDNNVSFKRIKGFSNVKYTVVLGSILLDDSLVCRNENLQLDSKTSGKDGVVRNGFRYNIHAVL